MTKLEWKQSVWFKEKENWGDPDLIKPKLVQALNELRAITGTPIIISCGTQGKHTKESVHPIGLAADIIFPDKNVADLPNLFLEATTIPALFGIGIYPHWVYSGRVTGGMHVDVKNCLRKRYWIGTQDGYIALNLDNINKHFNGSN